MAAKQAATVSDSLLELPGRDQLIADIPMDFAARRDDRLREVIDEAVDQAMEGERTEPLGKSRRALHVDEQEHPRFHAGRVIAAGDEVDEHVLAEQAVHVLNESEHERRGERDQHVYALNAPFSGRREEIAAKLETEQDDDEIDASPDRHMDAKRRPAKRRSEWAPQNEAIEGRQNTCNHRAGQRAAR